MRIDYIIIDNTIIIYNVISTFMVGHIILYAIHNTGEGELFHLQYVSKATTLDNSTVTSVASYDAQSELKGLKPYPNPLKPVSPIQISIRNDEIQIETITEISQSFRRTPRKKSPSCLSY